VTTIVLDIVLGVLAAWSWPGSRAIANTVPTPVRRR